VILIKGCECFSPAPLGHVDLLCGGREIIAAEEVINGRSLPGLTFIDGKGLLAVPGFIDSHAHFLGGGGEGGYTTRTPEIQLTDLTLAGVTTAVGCLGTDGFTRFPHALLAKSYALEQEGISTFLYTGSYQIPARTLLDSVEEDLLLIEKYIGVGEIAISDHRSSQPTLQELIRVASSARVGGLLAGKAGIVNIHVGEGHEGIRPLFDLIKHSEIPPTQFLPTHMNRNAPLAESSREWVLSGGYADFTASSENPEENPLRPARLFQKALSDPHTRYHYTYSSDAQGSLPRFDAKGRLSEIGIAKASSLLEEFRYSLSLGLSMEEALLPLTANPAAILGLPRKGQITTGRDADILLFDSKTLKLNTVIAKGLLLVRDNTPLARGFFER
jgi:beta-aspartyl-dipeptidase (metallo-type)